MRNILAAAIIIVIKDRVPEEEKLTYFPHWLFCMEMKKKVQEKKTMASMAANESSQGKDNGIRSKSSSRGENGCCS